MSSSRADSAFLVRALVGLALACLAFGAVGCFKARRCGGVEACNGKDDNCDGRIDEGFVDARGRYIRDDNCGRCGVSCSEEFPTAASTRCDLSEEEPVCRLDSCPEGFQAIDGNTCVQEQVALCLPCEVDDDCALRKQGAKCLELPDQRRCGTPCGAGQRCPSPFRCDARLGQCVPEGALCACQGVTEEVEVACLTAGSASGMLCAGVASCGPSGLSQCVIDSVESCDGEDNDCDGRADEDFVDAQGRYVGRLHCGACNQPCAPPGEHYEATCVVSANSASCRIACAAGFVDVDGIQGNGCECQRFEGSAAPNASGGDNNCDGVIDDDRTYVHVSTGGNDNAAGSLRAPLRTIQAGIRRAAMESKAVLVAQGNYDAFELTAGVNVFGGYRSDFGTRDPALYAVVIEHQEPRDGVPVLGCRNIDAATALDGVTFVGQDATSAGGGSTALLFDGCSSQVSLKQVLVLAGRGADGARGVDAANRLPSGVGSLSDLSGLDGRTGVTPSMTLCAGNNNATVNGGAAAQKSCGASDVSGGAGGTAACTPLSCRAGSPCGNAGCTDFTVGGVCDYAAVLRAAVPNPAAQGGRGSAPGAGGLQTYNSPTTRNGECSFCDDNPTLARLGDDGGDGQNGSAGAGGFGCMDPSVALEASSRGRARAGSDGQGGSDGSGGGGGSAGSGYSVTSGAMGCNNAPGSGGSVPGGSGGSGGSGGCAAPAGGAGQGGGASLGIVVRVNAAGIGPSFDGVRVVTESGGRGGDGGIGAAGGRGGRGAAGGGSAFWCARSGGRGGDGGDGGAGGGGGGGCGGASLAALLTGNATAAYRALVTAGLRVEPAGVPGQGGRGGFSPGFSGGQGQNGAVGTVF